MRLHEACWEGNLRRRRPCFHQERVADLAGNEVAAEKRAGGSGGGTLDGLRVIEGAVVEKFRRFGGRGGGREVGLRDGPDLEVVDEEGLLAATVVGGAGGGPGDAEIVGVDRIVGEAGG